MRLLGVAASEAEAVKDQVETLVRRLSTSLDAHCQQYGETIGRKIDEDERMEDVDEMVEGQEVERRRRKEEEESSGGSSSSKRFLEEDELAEREVGFEELQLLVSEL